jgi:hypothetical protein
MRGPSPRAMYAEMATLALRLGWGRDTLLDLEHRERRRWLEEIGGLEARS